MFSSKAGLGQDEAPELEGDLSLGGERTVTISTKNKIPGLALLQDGKMSWPGVW